MNGGTDKAIIIKFKDNTIKKSQAKVTQYQGIYVFTDCVPIKESNYISTIKISGILTSSYQYSHIRDRMITKCKKENSNAKGIILKLVYGESDTGDAISFTD